MRYRIALDLKLIRDEDKELEDIELFRNVFRRAKNEKILHKLWEEAEKAHQNRQYKHPAVG